jgi:hypothetical protein
LERWIRGRDIWIETCENSLDEIPRMLMKMIRDGVRGTLELGETRVVAFESVQQASIQELSQHVSHCSLLASIGSLFSPAHPGFRWVAG